MYIPEASEQAEPNTEQENAELLPICNKSSRAQGPMLGCTSHAGQKALQRYASSLST
jgi:hypothetical protein